MILVSSQRGAESTTVPAPCRASALPASVRPAGQGRPAGHSTEFQGALQRLWFMLSPRPHILVLLCHAVRPTRPRVDPSSSG